MLNELEESYSKREMKTDEYNKLRKEVFTARDNDRAEKAADLERERSENREEKKEEKVVSKGDVKKEDKKDDKKDEKKKGSLLQS